MCLCVTVERSSAVVLMNTNCSIVFTKPFWFNVLQLYLFRVLDETTFPNSKSSILQYITRNYYKCCGDRKNTLTEETSSEHPVTIDFGTRYLLYFRREYYLLLQPYEVNLFYYKTELQENIHYVIKFCVLFNLNWI